MGLRLGLAAAGALAGLLIAGEGGRLFGAVMGAALGFIAGRLRQLEDRLDRLERRADRLAAPTPADSPPPEVEAEADAVPRPVAEPPQATPPAPSGPAGRPGEAEAPGAPVHATPVVDDTADPQPQAVAAPPQPGALERLLAAAREWLTTGNVPVKLGVVISFFGVAFLLKYSIDRQLLVVPIEVRLLLVALAAIGLLGLGWRLRESSRVYGLSLQGGGVGILYLTIFAAFRLYGLLPAPLAFVLLVALTACAGLLAVLQDSRALAVLGIVGGFLAPVLASTGSGDHVTLFSYYLVLNLAILGIARYRAWRELNVLGFFFTFVIGTLWGADNYRPELFASTEPFLIAHFLLYQAVAVLFALRQPSRLQGLVDGTLVFGTPVATFALQAVLVGDTEYGLALSALAVALFYALLTGWLWRRHREALRMITESYLALAVAFATLAIPLALDARWTAASWALEGVALVWVGTRQHRALAKLAGGALVLFAGFSFALHGWRADTGMPVLNGNLLGGLLVAASSLVASRLLSAERGCSRLQRVAAGLLFLWGAGWWLGTGAREIEDRSTGSWENHLLTLWISLGGLLSTLLGRRGWSTARIAGLAHLPLVAVAALLYLAAGREPLAGWGALCWLGVLVVQGRILWDLDRSADTPSSRWHVLTLLALAAFGAWQVHSGVESLLNSTWAGSAAALAPALFVALILGAGASISWPIARHRRAYVFGAGVLAAASLAGVWLLVAGAAGDPDPLPYVPVLNPFDLVTLVTLVVGLWWLAAVRSGPDGLAPTQWRLGAAAWLAVAFALTTAGVVRGVVQLSGLAWRPGSMFGLVTVQAALSIYWGLLGVAGMVFGARRGRRPIWLAGAGLMGLVVAKLFLVDLGNTATVARIISFIGVGALLLAVGYFAPAPPRRPEEEDT